MIGSTAVADVRDVQIAKVDTQAGIVTLHNFGPDDQSLADYTLCTADDDEDFFYTLPGGFGTAVIEAGTDFNIHFNNDAPGGSDSINISAITGDIALPLDNGPYGFSIYWTIPFTFPFNMGDYVQWTPSLDDPGNATAAARAQTATTGGVWSAAADWIITDEATTMITLLDDTGAELHGPADYEVSGAPVECLGNTNEDAEVDVFDLLAALEGFGPCPDPCPPHCAADVNDDCEVDVFDLLEILGNWGPCIER